MDKKEELKQSVEVNFYHNQAMLMVAFDAFMSFIAFIIGFLSRGFSGYAFLWIFFANLIFAPFIIFYYYRIFHIRKYCEEYLFQEVILNEPHSFYRGSMYFTIEVIGENGERFKKDTRAIFYPPQVFTGPAFDDYFNQKTLIAYNPLLDEVVVIRLVKEQE